MGNQQSIRGPEVQNICLAARNETATNSILTLGNSNNNNRTAANIVAPAVPTSLSRTVAPTTLPELLEDSDIKLKEIEKPLSTSQTLLKNQILQIQSNKSLTPKEKAESMQKLMMKQWSQSQDLILASSPVSIKPVNNDQENERVKPTYHEEEIKSLGCKHYKRNCKLQGKCCGKWYTCRFCHDENENHAFDRYATETISCMFCHTIQGVSSTCINNDCNQSFGHYFCSICKFFDDDKEKEIYHCDKCKICRIGKGLDIDYFHCDKCNACMSTSLREHKCVERSLESDCPICHIYMFTSTTPVMFLPCGHCMHVDCYEDYTLTNYVCPLCSKSLGDMESYFQRIDELLKNEKMPNEYYNVFSKISCNDCEKKSVTKYHFIYHKCQNTTCNSYNTRVLSQFKDETIPEPSIEDINNDGNRTIASYEDYFMQVSDEEEENENSFDEDIENESLENISISSTNEVTNENITEQSIEIDWRSENIHGPRRL